MNTLRYRPSDLDQTGYNARWAYPSPIGGLGALGEDFQRGSESILIAELFDDIVKKADSKTSASGHTLAQAFGRAKAVAIMGMGRQLPNDQQAAWDKFSQWANGSTPTVWWAWVFLVATRGADLSNAAFSANPAWVTDPKEAANVLMVATGTSLTDRQWYDLVNDVFGWCADQIVKGLLNFNYLAAAVSGFLRVDTSNRKFPVWYAPTSVNQNDPLAKASWQAYLKESGWSAIVQKWAKYTATAWSEQTAANDRYLSLLGGVRTTLSYVSGEVVLQKIQAALSSYKTERDETISNIRKFNTYLSNAATRPMITEAQVEKMKKVESDFINIDTAAERHLSKAGLADLGPSGAAALQGLGWVQFAVAGTVAVALLGTIAWLVNRMTETNHAATKVYEEASRLVTDNIAKMTSSCDRDRAEGKLTEEQYRACIERGNALVSTLPKAPESALSSLTKTLLILGTVGLGAIFLIKKKP
jgi:hypothetical protein